MKLLRRHGSGGLAAETGVGSAGMPDLVASGTHIARRRSGRLGIVFWLAVAWVVAVGCVAITVRWLPLGNPQSTDIASLSAPIGTPHHLLGTDDLGRDMLARLAYGARDSFLVGFLATAIALCAGGAIGVVAGYMGGFVDGILMGAIDVLLAFPALLLALTLTTFLGQSLRNVILAIGILAVPAFARLARSKAVTLREREFVIAARALGARRGSILLREIVPNVAPPVLAFSLVVVGIAIVVEGSLSFLGLGVPPPTPTWGGMIAEGQDVLATSPHVSLIPAVVMFGTVVALNFVGDRLGQRLEVREGVHRT